MAKKKTSKEIRKTGIRGRDLIKTFESLELSTYICPAGIPTIGWGTTKIDGKPVPLSLTITKAEAEKYFSEDLAKFEAVVESNVTVALTQHMFDSLVSFVYNVGEGNFRASSLLRFLNAGNYDAAASQFVKWNKGRVNGKLVVLNGLTRRREAEKDLFLLKDNDA